MANVFRPTFFAYSKFIPRFYVTTAPTTIKGDGNQPLDVAESVDAATDPSTNARNMGSFQKINVDVFSLSTHIQM